jgi:hypothetical protein
MVINNSNKPTEWPGFMDTKSGETMLLLTAANSLVKEFSKSKNPRSQRVGTMIRNMCICMIENDEEYFKMFKEVIPIWDEISADWNDIFVSVGGKLGSGEYIEVDPNFFFHSKVMEFYSQYTPKAIMGLQSFLPAIAERDKELIQKEEYLTAAQLNKFNMFFHLVHHAISMQDKWFDTVEKILNSQADKLLSTPLLKELGVYREEDLILTTLYLKEEFLPKHGKEAFSEFGKK